jgi:predicted lipid-binding transport protein (Tim44 family)
MANKNNNNGISLTRGWKGYVGAIGCIALGIYLVIMGEKIAGSQLIFIGLALLGIRHKLDYENE